MEIINFGKYKGQPFDVLKEDPQYLEWLQNQAWFKRKYSQVNTLIINNFKEPSKTPDHNKLQIKFLDISFCDSLFKFLLDINLVKKTANVRKVEFVDCEHSKVNDGDKIYIPSLKDLGVSSKPKIRKEYWADVELNYVYKTCLFEYERADVMMLYCDEENGMQAKISIELKPVLSDDFPAVLRQCNSNKTQVLLIDSFDCDSATFEQVREYFLRSKILIVHTMEFYGKVLNNV